MARRLRLHVPGGFYHVTLRGNHRQAIFFADSDRDLLDGVVADSLERTASRLLAYCWMTNHLHMLVQIGDMPLGKLVLRVASRYARKVQAALETTGHLFERRYHAVLVDADEYLLTLVRYIHLNPVRAGLVTEAGHFAWSSHRDYLGNRNRPWVHTSFALRLLASDVDGARLKYRQLMNEPDSVDGDPALRRPDVIRNQILGDDAFLSRIRSARRAPRSSKTLESLIEECCRNFNVTPEALVSASRDRHLSAARASLANEALAGDIASISAVARRLTRSESAIRHLLSRRSNGPCK